MPKQAIRLYAKGLFVGFKRSQAKQDMNTSLIKIEGVTTKPDTDFYLGKRIAYIYKINHKRKTINGRTTDHKVIWGRVTRPHGNSGVVRAKFRKNLPPRAMGSSVRVMLYPSKI